MTRDEEVEMLKRGVQTFFSHCARHGMSQKNAQDLWEIAFMAGELKRGDKAMRDMEQFAKDVREIFTRRVTLFLLPLFLLVGCSKAVSSGKPSVERVFTTESNYVCFLIRDEAGKAAGGNCVRD